MSSLLSSAKAGDSPESLRPLELLLPEIPDSIQPFVMRTPTQYILLDHLAAKLVTTDKDGQITGDLAERWDVTNKFRTFTFYLAKNFWSDGKPILAEDIVEYFEKARTFGSATHIDFTNISGITSTSSRAIEFNLKKSDAKFLSKLRCPECGILHSSVFNQQKRDDFTISSGPYSLEEKVEDGYILAANNYYRHSHSLSPSSVHFRQLNTEKLYDAANRNVPFYAFMPKNFTISDSDKLKANKNARVFSPNIYFSHFLTINPKSELFLKRSDRLSVQSLVVNKRSKFNHTANFEYATGLALRDSPAFISEHFFSEHIKSITKLKDLPRGSKIRLLAYSERPFLKEISSLLTTKYDLEVIRLDSSSEFIDKISNTSEYDLAINRVDISSPDLNEHLEVIFNKKYPYLITQNEDEVSNILEKMKAIPSLEERYPLYLELTKILLTNGYMAPLFHERMNFYFNQEKIDISGLSFTYPDLRVWRTSIIGK